MTWNDLRLTFSDCDGLVSPHTMKEIWLPHPYLHRLSSTEEKLHVAGNVDFLQATPQGGFRWWIETIVVIQCQFEFSFYPFDKQMQCKIYEQLLSWGCCAVFLLGTWQIQLRNRTWTEVQGRIYHNDHRRRTIILWWWKKLLCMWFFYPLGEIFHSGNHQSFYAIILHSNNSLLWVR